MQELEKILRRYQPHTIVGTNGYAAILSECLKKVSIEARIATLPSITRSGPLLDKIHPVSMFLFEFDNFKPVLEIIRNSKWKHVTSPFYLVTEVKGALKFLERDPMWTLESVGYLTVGTCNWDINNSVNRSSSSTHGT